MNNVVLSTRNIDDFIMDVANEVVKKIIGSNVEVSTYSKNNDELQTRKQVSDRYGVSASTLWRWERDGRISSLGIGGKRWYNVKDLEAAMKRRKG